MHDEAPGAKRTTSLEGKVEQSRPLEVGSRHQPESPLEVGPRHESKSLHVIGAGHESQPLGSYLVATALFAGALGANLVMLRKSGRKHQNPVPADLFLLSAATMRLSQLITRDKVMIPLRAPFTEVSAQPTGEAHERPRGSGPTRAIGELLTCPRCTAMWASAALCTGYLWAPATVRSISLILTCSMLSDISNRLLAKLG